MLLDVVERLSLLQVLPQKGNIVTLRILDDLRRDLSFTEEEVKKFAMNFDGGVATWTGSEPKEVPLGAAAEKIIADELTRLDKTGELHRSHMGLYARLVEGKEGD